MNGFSGYPDNYRSDLDPHQSGREPSVDEECAYAAFARIERLKLALNAAIEEYQGLPGIDDEYGELLNMTGHQMTGDEIAAAVREAA